MAKAIGIDLGTTYSVAAYIQAGRPAVIPNAEGGRLTPSVVAFLGSGKRLVGQVAKLQALANPEGTVFSVKRYLGRQSYLHLDGLEDNRAVVRQIKRFMGSGCRFPVGEKEYSPEEISALILRKVKADAESYLGQPVEKAVVSVPAYFNESQRQATMDAAAIAGLEVLRLIDEPTAAALAYGLDLEEVHTIMVWDLGGGTFDVSILELGEGVFEVKAVNGNTWLGGDDYDQRIADYLADEFQKQWGVDLRRSQRAWLRLREMAEKAKIELSEAPWASVHIPLAEMDLDNLEAREITLTQAQLVELTQDLRQKMVGPTRQALADAGLKAQDIDRVVLVGGATRMSAVRELATQLIGREPYLDISPDEAVALGAAIQAGILTGEIKGKVLLNVTPLSLGIETQGGLLTKIIHRNTPIPVSLSQVFTNASDEQTAMEVHVLQGERDMAIDNMTLGRVELTGIPPLPRGQARVEVTFVIDVNGILQVSAHDLYSNSSQKLRVTPRFYGLSPQEVSRLVEEARSHALQDQRERWEVEMGIKADNLVRAAQQVVEEARGKADLPLLHQVEAKILRVQSALAAGQSREVHRETEELEEALKTLLAIPPTPQPLDTRTS